MLQEDYQTTVHGQPPKGRQFRQESEQHKITLISHGCCVDDHIGLSK